MDLLRCCNEMASSWVQSTALPCQQHFLNFHCPYPCHLGFVNWQILKINTKKNKQKSNKKFLGKTDRLFSGYPYWVCRQLSPTLNNRSLNNYVHSTQKNVLLIAVKLSNMIKKLVVLSSSNPTRRFKIKWHWPLENSNNNNNKITYHYTSVVLKVFMWITVCNQQF